MRPLVLIILSVVAVLVSACASGGATATPAASDAPATRIEVTLTHALKIEPAAISVPAGVPVTFVVTNTGTTDHEFFLGDEAAQTEARAGDGRRWKTRPMTRGDGHRRRPR